MLTSVKFATSFETGSFSRNQHILTYVCGISHWVLKITFGYVVMVTQMPKFTSIKFASSANVYDRSLQNYIHKCEDSTDF